MFTAVVATLAVNIAANVVSPANDFANAFPRAIDFKTGGLITGILGIVMQPWKLLADPSGYIFTWLLGYSGGLGSIAGVLIADYWVVRRKQLRLEDLYLPDGAYRTPRLELARGRGHARRLRAGLGRRSSSPPSSRSTTTPGSWASAWRSCLRRADAHGPGERARRPPPNRPQSRGPRGGDVARCTATS